MLESDDSTGRERVPSRKRAEAKNPDYFGRRCLFCCWLSCGWWNRFWPETQVAEKFFSPLQKQDFETAYGIYYHDPGWKQHPQNHAQYPFNEFRQDWGPGGQWGVVKSFRFMAPATAPGVALAWSST